MGPLVRNVCCFGQSKSFAGILLGTEKEPRADKEIDKKKADDSYELTEAEGKWQCIHKFAVVMCGVIL